MRRRTTSDSEEVPQGTLAKMSPRSPRSGSRNAAAGPFVPADAKRRPEAQASTRPQVGCSSVRVLRAHTTACIERVFTLCAVAIRQGLGAAQEDCCCKQLWWAAGQGTQDHQPTTVCI